MIPSSPIRIEGARPSLRLAAAGTAVLLLAALFSGCGAHSQQKRREAYERFYRGDFDSALEILREEDDPKSRLLRALDRGMIAHVRNRPEASNRAFAEAERIIEEQSATDVSDQAASLLVNDYQLEYKGEDFEKVLIHPIRALNYLVIGEVNEALVECRAVNEKLVELQEKYGSRNVYSEDAFARYLSGIIYESEGNLNDALVDYRLAVKAYGSWRETYGVAAPGDLIESVLRVSEANGVTSVFRSFRRDYPAVKWVSRRERLRRGEIVLVLENGQAPYKEAGTAHVAVGEELLSFSFPRFRPVPLLFSGAVLRAGRFSARTALVSNVTAIAIQDLDDRYKRVIAKELLRATVKQVEVKKVKEKSWLAGTLLNMVNSANEQADVRSWELLPANFQIARLLVEPGYYDSVHLDLLDALGGDPEPVDLGGIEIGAGETRFLYYRTLR